MIRTKDLPPAMRQRLGIDKPAPKRPTRIRGIFRSKLEAAFADHLAFLMTAKDIDGYWYEPVRFALGGRRNYKPDFLIEFADGRRLWVEVKGHMWSRDAVRLDWFNDAYPGEARWVVTRRGMAWNWKRVGTTERECPISPAPEAGKEKE